MERLGRAAGESGDGDSKRARVGPPANTPTPSTPRLQQFCHHQLAHAAGGAGDQHNGAGLLRKGVGRARRDRAGQYGGRRVPVPLPHPVWRLCTASIREWTPPRNPASPKPPQPRTTTPARTCTGPWTRRGAVRPRGPRRPGVLRRLAGARVAMLGVSAAMGLLWGALARLATASHAGAAPPDRTPPPHWTRRCGPFSSWPPCYSCRP